MTGTRMAALGLALAGVLSPALGADTFYVSTNGVDGANDGRSWAAAYRTISNAVAQAAAGDEVVVSNGTYGLAATVVLDKGITVRSVNGSAVTVVDGNNAVRGFIVDHADVVLDGFTVTRGVANVVPAYHASRALGGGAIVAAGTIRNCTFAQNSAQDGGGVYFMGTGTVLSNCVVRNNTATGFGGGLANNNHEGGLVTHCSIASNQAYVGGIWIKNGTLQNSVVTSNACVANYTGGIRQQGGTNRNCLIVRNTAKEATGGGLWVSGAGALVENATIARNRSGDYAFSDRPNRASAVRANYDAGVTLRNLIVWGNTFHPEGKEVLVDAAAQITYSCQTNWAGTGNLAADPLFYDADRNVFALRGDSPCVGAGANQAWMTSTLPTDVAGNPRLVGGTVDMGALEYAAPTAYYVSPDGVDGENDGLTWASALATISNALARTRYAGDEVVVSNGTYALTATVDADRPVVIRSVNGAAVTVVDGQNAVRCFRVDGGAIVEGFTVKRGAADVIPAYHATRALGGGALVQAGTIRNCLFTQNNAWDGGGVYFMGPQALVSNCVFTANTASGFGGGLANIFHYGGLVTDCTIVSNTAYAGGVRIDFATIQNSVVMYNHCVGNYAGGIRQSGGTNRNCLIARNTTAQATGAGLYVTDGGLVENATVAFNAAGTTGTDALNRSCGLRAGDNTTPVIRNTIVWGNTFIAGGMETRLASASQISYSCQTNWAGTGTIAADPQFKNAAGNDFALRFSSPCINAGTNQTWMTSTLTTDAAGNPRIVRDVVDMGALEAPPRGGTVVMVR